MCAEPQHTPPLDEAAVWETLKQVIDPEIGCNLVDLGLIYGVSIEGAAVLVTMTLTTQGCPMHQSLVWGVQTALHELPGVENVEVNLVWDPPWTPAMMTDAGREFVGYRQ